MMEGRPPLPPWLHKPLRGISVYTEKAVKKCGLCTVCEEASCPNLSECYQEKRATFLLLGSLCTRSCAFCGVGFSRCPLLPDVNEPEKVAACCAELALRHVVLTMVTRDDLEDGGALHVVKTIRAVRATLPNVTVEVLTSDFLGATCAVDMILQEKPEVFAHNLETVRSLSPKVRFKATYEGSLAMLRTIKERDPSQVTKSSLMVGLGESFHEVIETLKDLCRIGVDIVTIGQYLQPTSSQVAVKEWIHPDIFRKYEMSAKELGIQEVVAGPFVRSSYMARPLQRTML
jgi:lipoic acid synthetase